MVKTAGGLRVTVAGRKGFEVLAWVEALEDALGQARAKLVSEGGPAEDQAA
jgi:hypothetical protein